MNDYSPYGPIYRTEPPLTRDTSIYWVDGAWYIEQAMSIEAVNDLTLIDYMYHALTKARDKKMSELTWTAPHVEKTKRFEGAYVYVRHTFYECPFYREIKLFWMGQLTYTLRIMPQRGDVVELPLRRLMYHGERVRGALHDDVLYVIKPLAPA